MANRVPFFANVDRITRSLIQSSAKAMDISEGGVIDIWALWNNLENTSISPELRTAVANLKAIIKASHNGASKKRRGK